MDKILTIDKEEDFFSDINPEKFKLTAKGLEIIGASDALKKNIAQFPTYDDLLKCHTEHFKVKERLSSLGLL